jgi:ankyrin repeat protein
LKRPSCGKVIALTIGATWLIAILVYTVMRPQFKRGKELLGAAEKGDVAAVRMLLDQGASVQQRDREGHTALWLAAYFGRSEVAKALLDKGADPNARGREGWTPLMWAVQQGHAEVVRLLIERGADVNATGIAGETALKYTKGHPEIAALLRKAGARE